MTIMQDTQNFNKSLIMSSDYDSFFDKRTLFITGVGRSGTTILSKIIGSLQPTYCVIEPQMVKLIPVLYKLNLCGKRECSDLLKSLLFEDFIIPLIHGRNINFNSLDHSYAGNFEDIDKIKHRWSKYRRRMDVINDLKTQKVLFVIKIPEIQPLMSVIKDIFPSALFIHSIRNCNDVVSSSLIRRGWYTDSFVDEQLIGSWVTCDIERGSKIPWYIDNESRAYYNKWNGVTRSACNWRIMNEIGMQFCQDNRESCVEFKYEDFITSIKASVQQIMEFIEYNFKFKVCTTEITDKHLDTVKDYEHQEYSQLIDKIQEPEKSKVLGLLKQLGYGKYTKMT